MKVTACIIDCSLILFNMTEQIYTLMHAGVISAIIYMQKQACMQAVMLWVEYERLNSLVVEFARLFKIFDRSLLY